MGSGGGDRHEVAVELVVMLLVAKVVSDVVGDGGGCGCGGRGMRLCTCDDGGDGYVIVVEVVVGVVEWRRAEETVRVEILC